MANQSPFPDNFLDITEFPAEAQASCSPNVPTSSDRLDVDEKQCLTIGSSEELVGKISSFDKCPEEAASFEDEKDNGSVDALDPPTDVETKSGDLHCESNEEQMECGDESHSPSVVIPATLRSQDTVAVIRPTIAEFPQFPCCGKALNQLLQNVYDPSAIGSPPSADFAKETAYFRIQGEYLEVLAA